ncbi:Retrovirus-related Pol polyprotein from transposon [Nosema granulosis]|uniref:Retrovirus-related Pol polyprotein from transposon n=1 Tax=Nosema granulosis TaxID=83296 RepID=A0A9P6GW63_9MICR|nr:Retrovirus-related Pol polyprotein from transposon [Nosema granulosis]
MKQEIRNAASLLLPDVKKRFYIHADASNLAIGAVLSQEDDENVLKPVFCISRKLLPAEINYTVTEKECLAILWAVKKMKVYLSNEFTIRTDHQALKWLLDLKEAKVRLMRWKLSLQSYKYKVEYVQGKKNVIADALSRLVLIATTDKDRDSLNDEQKREIILRNHFECGHGVSKQHMSWS